MMTYQLRAEQKEVKSTMALLLHSSDTNTQHTNRLAPTTLPMSYLGLSKEFLNAPYWLTVSCLSLYNNSHTNTFQAIQIKTKKKIKMRMK